MTDIDIVEILRQKARGEKNSVGDFWGDLYLTKAADEIESLRAQNKRLMSRGIEDMKHEIESLQAERDRLREALEKYEILDEVRLARSKDCPGDHGAHCCGYPEICRAALNRGRHE